MSDNAAVLEQVLAVFRFDNASDYYERVWARNDWSMIYTPDKFVFEFGVTPMAHPAAWAPVILLYILFSFLLAAIMKNRERMELTAVVVVHNYILCFWSLAMLVGVVSSVYKVYVEAYPGESLLDSVVCEPKGIIVDPKASHASYWMYIYFLSKFYEMIDTYIIALKKRPLTFLQMYHHSIIVPLVFSWIYGRWSLSWYGVAANTLVHVFMYHYFAMCAIGRKLWWKPLMTAGQLLQFSSVFLLIFVFIGIAYVNPSLSGVWPFLQAERELCSGDRRTVVFSQLINITFLYLFGKLFVDSYLKKDTKAAGANGKSTRSKKVD